MYKKNWLPYEQYQAMRGNSNPPYRAPWISRGPAPMPSINDADVVTAARALLSRMDGASLPVTSGSSPATGSVPGDSGPANAGAPLVTSTSSPAVARVDPVPPVSSDPLPIGYLIIRDTRRNLYVKFVPDSTESAILTGSLQRVQRSVPDASPLPPRRPASSSRPSLHRTPRHPGPAMSMTSGASIHRSSRAQAAVDQARSSRRRRLDLDRDLDSQAVVESESDNVSDLIVDDDDVISLGSHDTQGDESL